MAQDLQIGHVEDGYRFMGGDPGERSSWQAVSQGETYANGRPRGLSATERTALEDTRASARAAMDILPDIDRFERLNRRQSTGGWLALPGVAPVVGAFDPEVAQINEISARLTPAQRVPGSGTTSDRDLSLFQQAVPGVNRPRQANDAILTRARSEARRRSAYSDFLDRFSQENGTLSGADELWRRMVESGQVRFDGATAQDNEPAAAPTENGDGAPQAASASGATPPPSGPPPSGVVRWADLSTEQQLGLQRGQEVELPNGEIVVLRGSPVQDLAGQRDEDRRVGEGIYVREPNLTDTVGAIATGAGEQIPGLDEAATATSAMLSGESYSEARDRYRGAQQYLNDTDRTGRNIGGIAGFAGTLALPGVGAAGRFVSGAKNVGQAVARGAGVGSAMTGVQSFASADGGFGERLEAGRDGAIAGAAIGGAIPGVARVGQAAGDAIAGATGRPFVNALRREGVSLTPGQAAGGALKTVEDLAQRAPILGPAIRGARQRAGESFSRAATARPLAAIGEELPTNIGAGAEAIEYVGRRLGQEFDRAAAMVPEVVADDVFQQGIARIGQGKTDLPPDIAAQFDTILQNRLGRLEGPITGTQLRQIESEITQLASRYEGDANTAGRLMGDMLADVGDEIQALMGRASPEAGEILNRARAGWADFVPVRRAGAAAGGRPFSTSQLQTAVRGEDGSVGKGATSRGSARMQDLSRAGAEVMPDTFGNPGTADAAGYVALGGLALANAPAAAAVTTGLGAAAVPYLMMGRKVVNALSRQSSPEEVLAADAQLAKLAQTAPEVNALREQIRLVVDNARNALLPAAGAAAGVATANALGQ